MKSKDFDLDFARRERYTYTKTSSSQGKVPGKSFGGSNTMSVALNTKHLSGFISEEEYAAIYPQVEAAHKQLEAKNGPGSDFLGWMYLPRDYDKEEFARIKAAAKKIREDSDVLVVAGIGGSYLGARAVVEAVKGQFHNELEGGPKIYFCGNSISPTYLNNILDLCKGKRFSINVISKSGTTTETSLAFRVLRELLEKEMGVEEANKRIYATTDRAKGTLKQLADAQGWPTFVVPDDVGGRYSVLSAVGLLPIAAAGIDIDELMQGAADAMERFSVLSPDNDAYKYAAIRNILYRKGKSIEILECYEPDFTLMNEWYKQLFGESEGKDNKGLFPASCIFSTDLHSMVTLLHMLLAEADRSLDGCETVCQDLLEVLLIWLVRCTTLSLQVEETPRSDSRECVEIKRYLDSNFREDISLDRLAEIAHINKYYLAHTFQKEYGISPITYLNCRRIEESKYMLGNTGYSLAQISELMGFSSPSYFSQCFRKAEGLTPNEYRRQVRQGQRPAPAKRHER